MELEKSGRYNAHLISPLLDEVTHNSKILDCSKFNWYEYSCLWNNIIH